MTATACLSGPRNEIGPWGGQSERTDIDTLKVYPKGGKYYTVLSCKITELCTLFSENMFSIIHVERNNIFKNVNDT